MSLIYSNIEKSDTKHLMLIENACHSHPWSEQTFLSCIGGRYFGEYANTSDETIGFYIGEYVAQEATLMDICVHPEQQGKGYGKTLLVQFIRQAKTKGAEKIWLEVRAKNISAQMLYINQGFIETGRRTGYYPSTIGYEDAIVMCLDCKNKN